MTDIKEIVYDLGVKQKEQIKLQLPCLRHLNMFLSAVSFESDYKHFDIKIFGKDNIVHLGEASLSCFSTFSLNQYITSILNSSTIYVHINNTFISKNTENKILPFKLTFTYKTYEQKIIFEHTYYSDEKDCINGLMKDIELYLPRATSFTFTNLKKLSLLPQFKVKNEENIIDTYIYESGPDGNIHFNVPDLFNLNINYYNLSLELKNKDDENAILKFGLIIFGN